MRSGYAPTTTGVPVGTVTVDGVAREVTAVSTVRELGGGGVPGVSATAAAEGNVTFGQLKNSDSGPAYSPWTRTGNWPPAPGSAVQAGLGTQLEEFRALTGVIDASSAGSDGFISSSIIDPVDRLHRKVTFPAMMASMPPLEFRGPLRNVGLSSDWIVDTALRQCASFSTPYMPATMSGVNVPGQGSVWPYRGTCTDAGQRANTALAADFLSTEWGWGIYNCDATYTPEGSITPAGGIEIGLMVSDAHAAEAIVSFGVTGSTASFGLQVTATRAVNATYSNGTTTTVIASLPALASGWRRVVARVSAGSIWIGTDDGRAASGSHPAPSPATTAIMNLVRIRVSAGGRIGGVIVANMPAGNYFGQTLNARLFAGTTLNPKLRASEAIRSRDAFELIGEIAKATCRAYWWDEDGLFQWMPGDYLLARTPSLTLTSTDSLIDLGWSEALSDTFSRVAVDHTVPTISRSRTPNVTVWQGAGNSYESGNVDEELFSPSGEDWVQVDNNPRLASGAFVNDINRGLFSVVGGVRTDGTTTNWAGGLLISTLSSIGPDAWKFTHTVGALPVGESMQLAFPNEAAIASVWQRWRGEKLPIVRAYGKIEWSDSSTVTGAGPTAAAEYQHAAGKWAQGYSGETPGRIAMFLAEWLCRPRVMATSVRVVHDPRIQVGDVHLVRDEHAHGVELKVLITRVAQSVEAGGSSMELDFFVIDGKAAFATLAQHDASQAGKTLTQHDTSEAGGTLAGHDADPLHTA